MPDNDIDYSQSNNSGFIQDLTLINLGRSGLANQINSIQRQNQEIIEDNQELQAEIAEKEKKAKVAQKQAKDLDFEVTDLEQTVRILRQEVHRLNSLFTQPLAEIAKNHPGFAKLYEDQMLKLGQWMVSEKAFKEVSLELGKNQGLSIPEIMEKVAIKQSDVLNNRNDPYNNTNITGSQVITPERAEKLKEVMLGQIPNKEQAIANIQRSQSQTTKPSTTNTLSR